MKYVVIHIKTGQDHGQHKSYALAQKRIGRLVAMSKGKQNASDWRIESLNRS